MGQGPSVMIDDGFIPITTNNEETNKPNALTITKSNEDCFGPSNGSLGTAVQNAILDYHRLLHAFDS